MSWLLISGFAGASAVAAGAAGAHVLNLENENFKSIYNVGSQYHLVHSVALASAALGLKVGQKRNIVCGAFSLGILFFSGSCYAVCITKQRKPYSYPAPVGGTLFITGWLALGLLP